MPNAQRNVFVFRVVRLALLALSLVLLLHPAQANERRAMVTVLLRPSDAQLFIDGVAQPLRAADQPISLAPGPHVFEASAPDFASAWRRATLAAGNDNEVVELRLVPALPPTPEPAARDETAAPEEDDDGSWGPPWGEWLEPNGPYVIVMGGFVGPLLAPKGFEADDGVQGGGTVGGRFGYRLAERLGVELIGQYGILSIKGTVEDTPEVKYQLQWMRMGACIRLLVPGKGLVRFVSTLGGGLVYGNLDWSTRFPGTLYQDADGIDGFGELEVGIEIEQWGVLFDLMAELGLQSTGGLGVEDQGESAFRDGALPQLGAVMGVGYGFW